MAMSVVLARLSCDTQALSHTHTYFSFSAVFFLAVLYVYDDTGAGVGGVAAGHRGAAAHSDPENPLDVRDAALERRACTGGRGELQNHLSDG